MRSGLRATTKRGLDIFCCPTCSCSSRSRLLMHKLDKPCTRKCELSEMTLTQLHCCAANVQACWCYSAVNRSHFRNSRGRCSPKTPSETFMSTKNKLQNAPERVQINWSSRSQRHAATNSTTGHPTWPWPCPATLQRWQPCLSLQTRRLAYAQHPSTPPPCLASACPAALLVL